MNYWTSEQLMVRAEFLLSNEFGTDNNECLTSCYTKGKMQENAQGLR